MPSTLVWKTARLLTKSWADGVVVYNLDSGNTHLLNPTAGEVLKYLEHSPAPAAALVNQLAAENNLEADVELAYNVDRLLNYLDTLGLIEPLTQ